MAVLKRSGSPNWHVEFEFMGRRIRRSSQSESKRKAEEFERKLRQQLSDQILLGRPVAEEMTIREATDRYVRTHLNVKKRKEKTALNDAYLLDGLIGKLGGDDVPLDSITTPVIADMKDRLLADGREAATANRYLSILKAILRKAHHEWGTLSSVPNIKLLPQNNERIRWLDDNEEQSLLAACQDKPHLHDLLVFLLDTGARLGEATGLIWKHVVLDRQPRGLVRFYETKSGEPRSVPLTKRVQLLLERLHTIRDNHESHVFLIRLPGCKTRRTQPQAKPFYNPHGSWKTAVKNAGLSNVRLHDLRHTFASRLVQLGVPLLAVSKLLGHASLKMTMRYAHLAPDNLDDAISHLD